MNVNRSIIYRWDIPIPAIVIVAGLSMDFDLLSHIID